MKALGATQIAILRTVSGGRAFICSTASQYQAALKLNAKGLIDRDLRRGMSKRFIGNAAGEKFIINHDDAIAARLGE